MSSYKIWACATVIFFCILAFRSNAATELDATFGNHSGYVTTNISNSIDSDDYANSLVRLVDGSLLVVGQSDEKVVVVKYDRQGVLDSSFAENGILETNLSANDDLGHPLLLQGQDKFIIAGVENNHFVIARYSTSGTLDTGFADMGYFRSPLTNGNSEVFSILEKSNGNLIIAGRYADWGGSDDEGGLLVEIDGSGQIVSSFGTDGIIKFTHPNGFVAFYAATLQQDGKILAAGVVQGSGFNSIMLVSRFSPDGSIDAGFGQSGVFILTENTNKDYHGAYAIVEISTGDIIVGGSRDDASDDLGQLVGLNPDGGLNSDFGNNGILNLSTLSNGSVTSLLEEREHLIIGGTARDSSGITNQAYLLRTDFSGVMDREFGVDGAFALPADVEDLGRGNIGYFEGAYFVAGGDADAAGEVGDITVSKVLDTSYVAEPTIVEFSSASQAFSESAGEVAIQIARSGSLSSESMVDYRVINNTAVEGEDFNLQDGSVTFTAGESVKDVTMSIIDDGNDEANESFSIELTNLVDADIGAQSSVTITITDNDTEADDTPSSSGGGSGECRRSVGFPFNCKSV